MRKYLPLLLCAAGLQVSAQDKKVAMSNVKEKDFATLNIKLGNMKDGDLVFFKEPYGQFKTEDSFYVKNNQIQIKVPVDLGGTVYIVQVGKSQVDHKNGTVVYLEKGTMNITSKSSTFENMTFTGSQWALEWGKAYNDILDPHNPTNTIFNNYMKRFSQALAVGDEEVATEMQSKVDSMKKLKSTAMRQYIQEHKNSGVSAYLALYYFKKPWQNELLASLGEHAHASRIVRRYLYPGKYEARPEPPIKFTDPNAPGPTKTGTPVENFSAPDVNGKMVSLSDFKGKYVLLDFWASWCGPCVTQMPFLKTAAEKYKDRNFVVLGISLDSHKEGWVMGIAKHSLPWTNISHLKGWSDPIAKQFGFGAIPANVLVGPDGKVVASGLFGDALGLKLAEILDGASATR